MRVIVVLVALVAALAAAMPLQNAMTQDTIVDLTPYFADGLEEGHALLANLTIGYTDAAPSINGRAFSLGSTVTMEVPAALTDMSADGKVTVQAMVILDAGAYQADLDGMTQIHIQAIIRAVNRVALGAVSAVSEVVITVDSNNNEMSRTQNEIALEDSVLSSVADEVTTDMFEIDVIVITHGKTQQQTEGASPDSSESSDSSDSSESSDSSDSSDSSESSESSESSHSFSGHHHQGGHHHDGGDWDEKWEMYESSVRGKIHRALHSACSWFHRQPFYVKASIGFGISLVFFAMFYTCLRCLAPSKPAVATTAPASKASVFGGKVYEYSEKNLDFPLDDLAYETKPLIVFTDDVQRV